MITACGCGKTPCKNCNTCNAKTATAGIPTVRLALRTSVNRARQLGMAVCIPCCRKDAMELRQGDEVGGGATPRAQVAIHGKHVSYNDADYDDDDSFDDMIMTMMTTTASPMKAVTTGRSVENGCRSSARFKPGASFCTYHAMCWQRHHVAEGTVLHSP